MIISFGLLLANIWLGEVLPAELILRKPSKENFRMGDNRSFRPLKSPSGLTDRGATREALTGLENGRRNVRQNEKISGPTERESIAERLQIQRQMAFKALEAASTLSQSDRISLAKSPKKIQCFKSPSKIPRKYLTIADSVPQTEFNISDLVTDHTMELKSMSNKISFEPSEITGRSTMCQGANVNVPKKSQTKSVKEILAQSLVEDVRSLSETLPNSDYMNGTMTRTIDNVVDADTSSSFRMSFPSYANSNNSAFHSESFKPAELMSTRLSADERSWAQQYADIPEHTRKRTEELTKLINDTMQYDNKISIGDFFSKHSESLSNLMPNMTSPQKRPPVALHEDSTAQYEQINTPKADGIRYSLYSKSNAAVSMDTSSDDNLETSHQLNMMAIKKALYEINTDDSITAIRNKISLAKNDIKNTPRKDLNVPCKKLMTPYSRQKNLAEKENYATKNNSSLEDTLCVTKSMLELSGNICDNDSPPSLNKNTMTSHHKNRKRSHSSTRLNTVDRPELEVPIRRSRSPTTHKELTAASKSNISGMPSTLSKGSFTTKSNEYSMTESDRQFLIETKSPDCGKFSLPTYGAISQTTSTLSNAEVKQRSNSQCSSSSEYTHRGGKLPIKVSKLEIVWGCVKLRKSVQKSVAIRNMSNKRLSLKAEIFGPGYQLVTTPDMPLNIIRLQEQECRTFSLNFCPTVIGNAAGQLVLSTNNNKSVEGREIIKLYAFGGHSTVVANGILKGPVGGHFLELGELKQLSRDLNVSFTVTNKGSVKGFAAFFVDNMGLEFSRLYHCIDVNPSLIRVNPESSATVTITFRPRREDVKKICKKFLKENAEVISIANMEMLTGEDETRFRLLNLINQMNDAEKSSLELHTLKKLWDVIPAEVIPIQNDIFKEKVNSAIDLLTSFNTKQIALTLSHTISNDTVDSTLLFSENDETVMFRTIVSDESFCNKSNCFSTNDENSEPIEHRRNTLESWSVCPNQIVIDPIDEVNCKAAFTIYNRYLLKKSFRIDMNAAKHLFNITPNEGSVMSGESVVVRVRMKFGLVTSEPIQIWVYLGDSKITLPVIVNKDKFPVHLR